jgi:hypothetical protein
VKPGEGVERRLTEDSMAAEMWVATETRYCDIIKQPVEFKEKRAYPTADFLHMVDRGYRVRVCTCSMAEQCNLTGISCAWAFNYPGNHTRSH